MEKANRKEVKWEYENENERKWKVSEVAEVEGMVETRKNARKEWMVMSMAWKKAEGREVK